MVSTPPADRQKKGRQPQPLLIRLAHWLNVPLLVLLAGSGLQILVAYPMLGPRGALYSWYLWQGTAPPTWLRFGGWLAGARHWHFALAWLLMVNAGVYLVYLLVRGEWRRRAFRPGRDMKNAVAMAAYYLRIRRTPPLIEFYNGLQRLAYTVTILLGVIEVLSGLARRWIHAVDAARTGRVEGQIQAGTDPYFKNDAPGEGNQLGPNLGCGLVLHADVDQVREDVLSVEAHPHLGATPSPAST